MNRKKQLRGAIASAILLAAFIHSAAVAAELAPAAVLPAANGAQAPVEDTRLRILIVGDSTVREYQPPRSERGWGQYMEERFKANSVRVINRAQAGRSTKTFISQGWWKKGLAEKPDYVLIQFGHNDSHGPDKPESTDAATSYRDFLRRYVDDSVAIGATPIFVTPMVQRKFDAEGHFQDDLQRYADAMKEVAAEKGVPVIDLHASSKKLVLEMGPARSVEMANKKEDTTHFNEKGARIMADLVVAELKTVAPKLKDLWAVP